MNQNNNCSKSQTETPNDNNIPTREWLEKMAELEDGRDVTVGCFADNFSLSPVPLMPGDTFIKASLVCPDAPDNAYVIVNSRRNVTKKNHHGPCGRA